MKRNAEFGIVGLGRMGANLALQALDRGMRVAGYTAGPVPPELIRKGFVAVEGPEGFRTALRPPRKIFLYVPAGKAVDEVIERLSPALEPGDIIVDGGNSYWGDSRRRYVRLRERGLRFVDLGTSGGVEGARSGACFMAGGDGEVLDALEPVLAPLAVEGGYVRAGGPGAGHFVKLVHNGIEFGMLQAIGEGIDLLERYPGGLPVADILRCWRHGSVIRSWLIDLMEKGYREQGGLARVPPYVDDTGEVDWLVADALEMEAAVPVIAASVMQLFASRDARRAASRAVAVMRRGFGGHAFGKSEAAERERRSGRVGDFVRGGGNDGLVRRTGGRKAGR